MSFGPRLPSPQQARDLLYEEALRRARGNQSAAAGLLGISHQAFSKWRQGHGRASDGE